MIQSFKISILISFICYVSAFGGVAGSPDLDRLTREADAIVVADLSQAVAGTAALAIPGTATLDLRIIRVLKGVEPAGAVVQATWLRPPAVTGTALPSGATKQGIVFLKRSANQLSPISFTSPSTRLEDVYIPAVSPVAADYLYQPQTSPFEKVLNELANAVDSMPENPLLQFVHHGSLEKHSSPAMLKLYTSLSQDNAPSRKVLGLAGLLRRGDPGALKQLELQWTDLMASPNRGLLEFGIEASYRNPDPAGVAVIGRLANNAALRLSLRKALAGALASIHSRESVPFLVQLLDSPDLELQSWGVGGLAFFANHGPGKPGAPMSAQTSGKEDAPFRTKDTLAHFAMGGAFEKNRDNYVQFWKAWWAEHRQKLSP